MDPWIAQALNSARLTTAELPELIEQTFVDCGVRTDSEWLPIRPFMLPADTYEDLHAAGRRMVDLLAQVVRLIAPNREARIRALNAQPDDYPLFGDPLLEEALASVMARPDAVMGPDGPRFLEFNVSGTFGGTTESHLFFKMWPAIWDWDDSQVYGYDSFCARKNALDDITRALSMPRSVLYVGSQADVPGARSRRYFELELDYLREAGYTAEFASPENLLEILGAYAPGKYPLGLKYFNTQDWAEAGTDLTPVRTALKQGWRLVPPQSAGFVANKRVLAWLSELPAWLSADEVDFVTRWLPWTREVRQGTTVWEGVTHDLVELLTTSREHFVIKPCIGMMGRDVTIGLLTSPTQWRRTIDRAIIANDCVVQEFVPSQSLPMTLANREGHIREVNVRPVFSPCIYGEHPGGCWTRFFPDDSTHVVSVYGHGALENIALGLLKNGPEG